jgi:hypothetical protein
MSTGFLAVSRDLRKTSPVPSRIGTRRDVGRERKDGRTKEPRTEGTLFSISTSRCETRHSETSFFFSARTCAMNLLLHFPTYPGSLSLDPLAYVAKEKCFASPIARSSSPTPVPNTLPRSHSVQRLQAGHLLGTEAQLANSPEPRSVAAQRCGVSFAFLTISDCEASRVLIFFS